MGQAQMWKKIDKWKDNPIYNEQLDKLRKYINSGASEEEVGMFRNELPIYKKIKKLLDTEKKNAEKRIADDPRYEHLNILGLGKQRTKQLMSQNKIEEAAQSSRDNYAKRQFLKHGVK